MQMEPQGLCVVERPMNVDLLFSSTAATIFWDQQSLAQLQGQDGNTSKNTIMAMVSESGGFFAPQLQPVCFTRKCMDAGA